MSQIILLAVLAVIPGYVLFETSGYPVNSYDDSGGGGLFPAGIAWVMLILIVIQIIRTAMKLKETEEAKFLSLFKGVPGVFLLCVIGYAILTPFLGFIISSCLFLTVTGGYMSYMSHGVIVKKQIAIQTAGFVVFSVGLYLFFRLGINIYLPTGFLGI